MRSCARGGIQTACNVRVYARHDAYTRCWSDLQCYHAPRQSLNNSKHSRIARCVVPHHQCSPPNHRLQFLTSIQLSTTASVVNLLHITLDCQRSAVYATLQIVPTQKGQAGMAARSQQRCFCGMLLMHAPMAHLPLRLMTWPALAHRFSARATVVPIASLGSTAQLGSATAECPAACARRVASDAPTAHSAARRTPNCWSARLLRRPRAAFGTRLHARTAMICCTLHGWLSDQDNRPGGRQCRCFQTAPQAVAA